MVHINRWDYEKATVELNYFLSFKQLTSYNRYIGIVNLMASLVALGPEGHTKTFSLEKELNRHLLETERLGYKILYANLLEIKSQLIVQSSPHKKKAEQILQKASALINNPHSKEYLFIKKWELISNKSSSKKWIEEMWELKAKACAINHVETIRDIDYHLAEFDDELLEKVYFGTPYESFRSKITSSYHLELPAAYWLNLRPDNSTKKFEFDYLNYEDLKIGSVILKVLKAMTHDFYKTQNMYTLFELIFPNDYLNPNSSFNKVHQALNRTRKWIHDHKIPLEIIEDNEEYFFKGNVKIKIYLNDRVKLIEEKKDEAFFHELKQLGVVVKEESFSATEAMNWLNHTNVKKTQRLLKKALEMKMIEKYNQGKKTIYKFTCKVA